MMNTLLLIGGILHIAVAIFHLMFWKLFAWERQLVKLQPINKGAMQAMNLVLILVFLFFAALSIFFQDELLTSTLGIFILGFISFMWLVRFFAQFAFFKAIKGTNVRIFLGLCIVMFNLYGFIAIHLFRTL